MKSKPVQLYNVIGWLIWHSRISHIEITHGSCRWRTAKKKSSHPGVSRCQAYTKRELSYLQLSLFQFRWKTTDKIIFHSTLNSHLATSDSERQNGEASGQDTQEVKDAASPLNHTTHTPTQWLSRPNPVTRNSITISRRKWHPPTIENDICKKNIYLESKPLPAMFVFLFREKKKQGAFTTTSLWAPVWYGGEFPKQRACAFGVDEKQCFFSSSSLVLLFYSRLAGSRFRAATIRFSFLRMQSDDWQSERHSYFGDWPVYCTHRTLKCFRLLNDTYKFTKFYVIFITTWIINYNFFFRSAMRALSSDTCSVVRTTKTTS